MLITIDVTNSVAVYTQIKNHIQYAIASGDMEPGAQLPSVRELSERLEINPNTVAKAYRDLEVIGLLHTRRGMGVFVNDDITPQCRRMCHEQLGGRLYGMIREAKASGMSDKVILDIVKKSNASPDAPYGAPPTWIADVVKKS